VRQFRVQNPESSAAAYPVVFGAGLGPALVEFLRQEESWCRLAIIADEVVAGIHGEPLRDFLARAGFQIDLFTFPAGEASKTRETKTRLEDGLLRAGMGRDAAILALGGGVAIDLGGFTAATFMRGIPFVALPTSTLAMVDSSVGGKTGVDTPAGKNLIGAFHPPAAVFADLESLESLPEPELRSGFAEAIKHGLIHSPDHLHDLERHARSLIDRDTAVLEEILFASVRIKAHFVELDEREVGARKALNFGHTFAHALERLSSWSLPHGEAVSRGLVAESDLSAHLGLLDVQAPQRVREVLRRFGLPSEPFGDLPKALTPAPDGPLDLAVYQAATRADKKARRGQAEYVLLREIGSVARSPDSGAWARPVDDAVLQEVLFPAHDVPGHLA
jgi:3-dehydroquinate synthase